MKSAQQIEEARGKVAARLRDERLEREQRIVLTGMSVALQWVADAGGTTLQRLLDDEPITQQRRP